MQTIARRFFIRGRVQGVGFRWFVERAAHSLSLRGYARNLADGRVEVYAVGSADGIKQLTPLLAQGPAQSEVLGIEEMEAAVEAVSGFRIR